MNNREFVVVNAFANGAFGGNPAAVFPDASGLSAELMQAFAKQLNLVETVFVFQAQSGGDFRLRYFTPQEEIPVAGHPSIAAWIALVQRQIVDTTKRSRFLQENMAGMQEIEIIATESGTPIVTMKQQMPRFIQTHCTDEEVASTFAIEVSDISSLLPIGAVHTGLGHLIVPLNSLDALFRVKRNVEPLRRLCHEIGVREAQLFSFEAIDKSFDMHTRNLCPREGLEDPACGVGNGALAAYLSQYQWPKEAEVSLRIEQGNIVQMPSTVHTRTVRAREALEVFVGGTGVCMMEGRVLV